MERMMGRADTPLRRILNYAQDHFCATLPLVFILTVVGPRDDGSLAMRGLYIGSDAECFHAAAELSMKVNFTVLDEAPKKMVVYLDAEEFHSTWLGFGGWGWGWGLNWFGRGLIVNNLFFNRYGFHQGFGLAGGISGLTPWAHDPAHRLGASYPNGQLNSRFGAASQASRLAAGRSGNWHSFGEGNIGGSGAASRAGVGAQSFQGGNYRPGASAPRFAAPGQSAPAYQVPQRSFQAAPRTPAPSYGGGARSLGSFGSGGVSHAAGGVSHGGGGGASHGGGRR